MVIFRMFQLQKNPLYIVSCNLWTIINRDNGHRRREFLGGSGGMLPQKILKIGSLKTPFSALSGRNMWQNLKDEIIFFCMNSGTGFFSLHFLLQPFLFPETELAGNFFFKNVHPPPPPQELNGRPLTIERLPH